MMETKENAFRIRMYGFSQLALFYCPELTKKSAGNKFRKWIDASEDLQAKLKEAGYLKGSRTLTPKQVGILVDHLGQP